LSYLAIGGLPWGASCTLSVTVSLCPLYRVPVVHFLPMTADGAVVPLEEVLQSSLRRDVVEHAASPYDVIGHAMHPLLQIPYYIIQPCTTSALLGVLLSRCREENTDDDSQKRQRTTIEWVLMTMGRWIGIELPEM